MLQSARRDPAKLALATVDFVFAHLPVGERTELKKALTATAIPHWCDVQILATLLRIPREKSRRQLNHLRRLNVIEPFPARGVGAVNVHEATRLALRKRIAREHPRDFRLMSGRAALYFAADRSPAGQIEWLYHRLCAEPEAGAIDCERLERRWSDEARPEDRDALALALDELETTKLVTGRARVEVRLCAAEARSARDEEAGLGAMAREICREAQRIGHRSGEARAICLWGDSLQARGKLTEAEKMYREFLRLSEDMVRSDKTNEGWQRDLALAHGRMGVVLQERWRLAAAATEYAADFRISRWLSSREPENVGRLRGLAVAVNRMGHVLQMQGDLKAAEKAFRTDLRISRSVAKRDSNNLAWQRDLAAAYNMVGDVLQARGKLNSAERMFRADLRISQRLVKTDSTNLGWRQDLAIAYGDLAEVLRARGKLWSAEIHSREDLRIAEDLVRQDKNNMVWQRGRAIAHRVFGEVMLGLNRPKDAETAFRQCLRISQLLARHDQNNVSRKRDLATALAKVGVAERRQGKFSAALRHFEAARRIFNLLAKEAPALVGWLKEAAQLDEEIAATRRTLKSSG